MWSPPVCGSPISVNCLDYYGELQSRILISQKSTERNENLISKLSCSEGRTSGCRNTKTWWDLLLSEIWISQSWWKEVRSDNSLNPFWMVILKMAAKFMETISYQHLPSILFPLLATCSSPLWFCSAAEAQSSQMVKQGDLLGSFSQSPCVQEMFVPNLWMYDMVTEIQDAVLLSGRTVAHMWLLHTEPAQSGAS